MEDVRLRELKRAALDGGLKELLEFRSALKRAGKSSVDLKPDLNLRFDHSWEVVGADRDRTFGDAHDLLVIDCMNDGGLHPFIGGNARPLTFKETVQARINQFRAFQDAGKSVNVEGTLWTTFLDTSTAIIYKKNSTKFKIVQLSLDLLKLSADDKREFLQVNYDSFTGVEELDVTNPEHGVYNQLLTWVQVVGRRDSKPHMGWLAALGGDTAENRAILNAYAAIVFALLKRDTAMRFWTVSHQAQQGMWIRPQDDQLRALCAEALVTSGSCNGGRNLHRLAHLAQMRPL